MLLCRICRNRVCNITELQTGLRQEVFRNPSSWILTRDEKQCCAFQMKAPHVWMWFWFWMCPMWCYDDDDDFGCALRMLAWDFWRVARWLCAVLCTAISYIVFSAALIKGKIYSQNSFWLTRSTNRCSFTTGTAVPPWPGRWLGQVGLGSALTGPRTGPKKRVGPLLSALDLVIRDVYSNTMQIELSWPCGQDDGLSRAGHRQIASSNPTPARLWLRPYGEDWMPFP